MGPLIREDDHLISSLLDLANLRFAPSRRKEASDGIHELKDLQKKFEVFSDNHSLADSFALLGLGGYWNTELKAKWRLYLEYLSTVGSQTKQSGDRAVVAALAENLASRSPYPVYFKIHDMKKDPGVLIERGKPLTYMTNEYLIISLPMTPWLPGAKKKKK